MMLWAASERGLDKSEEVVDKLTNFQEEYAIDRLYENEFMSNLPTPSAEEIQNYYNEHKDDFYSPDIADVRIILTETIEEALEAKKFIEEGGDPLEAVYKFSLNKSFGGFYNISTNSQARPELKEMVLQMEPGEITDPVESQVQSGYEVAYVIDRQYEHYKTLEDPEVRSQVIRGIWASEENINELDLLSKKWMDDILSKYSYSIFEDKLDIALKEAKKIKDKKEREYLQKEIIK
jgi:parvulin-like peptidyl-prolyl isomerase